MEELSEVKRLLLRLSDKDIMMLFNAANVTKSFETFKITKSNSENKSQWFDININGLSKDGLKRLKELEDEISDPVSSHHVDRKQLRYLRTLKRMKMNVPELFREKKDPKTLYKRLTDFCRHNDIPEKIVSRIVPALVSYIETGHMRPIIFVGDKGCGKTTAVRMLVEEALHIATEVIKVPQLDGGHGMTGDCGSYQSADVGCIAKAQLKANSILVAYIFDEIDKVSENNKRANVDDELLSITDESNSDIYENYLECSIVGLNYCPMFFTANDIKKVNPILADRCTVIRFPNATVSRLQSIAKKYVDKKMNGNLYQMIDFNYELMDKSIEKLVNQNVTSIRKHQQMIEEVLENALNIAFVQEADEKIEVTPAMFAKAEEDVVGVNGRVMGFHN